MQPAALVIGVSVARQQTFDEVVRQRETEVLRVAHRMLGNWADAENVAQEAFVRLHRRGLKFDGDGALRAWLYRVTCAWTGCGREGRLTKLLRFAIRENRRKSRCCAMSGSCG